MDDIKTAVQRYASGGATEEEAALARRSIEAYQAVTDYLYAGLEAELGGVGAGEGATGGAAPTGPGGPGPEQPAAATAPKRPRRRQKDGLTRRVNRAIRHAFLKAGAVVFVLVLAAVLFIQFAAPGLVAGFYYDPTRVVAPARDQIKTSTETVVVSLPQTTQLQLDLTVYNELRMPTNLVTSITAVPRGYGNYDIGFWGKAGSAGGAFQHGTINKNALNLADTSVLRPTYYINFGYMGPEGVTSRIKDTAARAEAGGTPTAGELIDALPETLSNGAPRTYLTMLVFDQPYTYQQVLALQRQVGQGRWWLGVKTMEERYTPRIPEPDIGVFGLSLPYYRGTSYRYPVYNPADYPLLQLDREDPFVSLVAGDEPLPPLPPLEEETVQGHFYDMLDYFTQHETFTRMMGDDPAEYADAKAYVEEHGLLFYGAYLDATVPMLQRIEEIGGLGYHLQGPDTAFISNYMVIYTA